MWFVHVCTLFILEVLKLLMWNQIEKIPPTVKADLRFPHTEWAVPLHAWPPIPGTMAWRVAEKRVENAVTMKRQLRIAVEGISFPIVLIPPNYIYNTVVKNKYATLMLSIDR